MSTLQNGTLITFYEHYKINLETVLVEKKDKILGFDLVCLFQLFLKVSIFSKKDRRPRTSKVNKQRVPKFKTLENETVWYSFNKYEVQGYSILLRK